MRPLLFLASLFLASLCRGDELWSLRPLVKPAVPGGEANPLDAFIRAALAKKNLTQSPEADPRTFIRRVTFDLTGLPPAPEQVEAFIRSEESCEALVDSLLASPRYGEHWARHWLDVAHYADTHGNDHDHARPNAWPYRDYVIRSLNDDKPYARFVQEQVAGDALFPDDPQATVALGFLAAGPWDDTLMVTVREDTFDHRLAQVLDRDDMVTTVMSAFQSLTVHCARCHDHKFDPVTQREYYALQAVFAGVDRADRPFDADAQTQSVRQKLLAKKKLITARSSELLATLDSPAVVREVAGFEEGSAKRAQAWTPLEVVSIVSTGGATLTRQPDGSWFVSGTRPVRDTYIVTARHAPGMIRAMRLEALPDDRLPQRGPGRFDNGHFHLTEFRAFAAAAGATDSAKPIVFSRAAADVNEGPAIFTTQATDGSNDTHWGIHPHYGEPHEAVFELKEPAEFAEGTTFTVLLEHQGGATGHGLGRFRLSASGEAVATSALAPPPTEIAAILRVPAGERSDAQRRELTLAVLAANNERELSALPAPQLVYAVTNDFPVTGSFKPAAAPRPVHLLTRGDLNKPAELVSPGALACVTGMDAALAHADVSNESARRAALARWLTDDRNVLTWRSIVNRVWHYHFGRGLCDTPNDFGKMGGTPSHPELLDWLAVWFRDDAKGSLKALHRLIVTSKTYRQVSSDRLSVISNQSLPERTDHRSLITVHSAAKSQDPDNRVLSRMNRTRLTAEQVRDSLLQISGQLDLTMGGPSAVQFVHRGKATFNPDGGAPAFLDYENFAPDAPENRRRAVYRFMFRTVADPLMDALDAPDGGAITPVRSQSTTAVQAFALLNNVFVIRQCEHIAARVNGEVQNGTDSARVVRAFWLLLQRAPDAGELTQFAAYAQKHGLANACQVIINSNEFLYLD